MSCEHERHLVELAERLVEHYHDRMEQADSHLQELLEDIPDACEHVGLSGLGRIIPSRSDGVYYLADPSRSGPRRALDRECFEAIQAYRAFRMIDIYRATSLWIKADRMLERFRNRLEECEHAAKGA